MIPKGIDVRVLNKLVNELREKDLWAERHSYSIRIMHRDKFVSSIHLYPGYNEAVIRIYTDEVDSKAILGTISTTITKYLPGFTLRIQYIERKPV